MTEEERGKIYVSNLPFDITQDEIKEIFGKYGELLDIFYINSRNLNFKRVYITYPTIKNARAAVAGMNYHDVRGYQLTVQMTQKDYRHRSNPYQDQQGNGSVRYRYFVPYNKDSTQDPYYQQYQRPQPPQYQTYQQNYNYNQYYQQPAQQPQQNYQYDSRYQDYYRGRDVPPTYTPPQQTTYDQYPQNQQYQSYEVQYQPPPPLYPQYPPPQPPTFPIQPQNSYVY